MSIESDNKIAALTLARILDESVEYALDVLKRLDELGWELREYKYHMTPDRWEQMGERQVNP